MALERLLAPGITFSISFIKSVEYLCFSRNTLVFSMNFLFYQLHFSPDTLKVGQNKSMHHRRLFPVADDHMDFFFQNMSIQVLRASCRLDANLLLSWCRSLLPV